ncbi:MAG TPA: hypothetical protein P5081_17460 [Phycisphaerae bacterium]|nr:hypothetical protein [Phycisphaerae bacterium]HRW54661.1 hypothetical protein [Phycisphaerae bacterium]
MTERDEQLELLTAYLDGEASDAQRAEVETLIAADPDARRLLAELRRTSQLVAGLPHSSAPTQFSRRIVARLEREALLGADRSDERRWTLGNWSALAASIALVVVAGWWVLPRVDQLRAPAGSREVAVVHTQDNEDRKDMRLAARAPAKESPEVATTASVGSRNDNRKRSGRGGAAAPVAAGSADKAGAVMKSEEPEASQLMMNNCMSVRDAAEIDQNLTKGRLTPDEIENASADAFTNRILVEVPSETAVPIVSQVVEDNFVRNDLRCLDQEPKDKPLSRNQRFFARQQIDLSDADDNADGARVESGVMTQPPEVVDDAPVRQYVLNASRRELKDIVAALQDACASRGIEANYDVNGAQFGNSADPAVFADNLYAVVDWNHVSTSSAYDSVTFGDSWTHDDESPRQPAAADVKGDASTRSARAAGDDGVRPGSESDDRIAARTTPRADGQPHEAARPGTARPEPGEHGNVTSEKRTDPAMAPTTQPTINRSAPTSLTEKNEADHERSLALIVRNMAGDADVVGPMPAAPVDDAEIVTCVVTIRPTESRDNATPNAAPGGVTPTSAPASQPTRGAGRG